MAAGVDEEVKGETWKINLYRSIVGDFDVNVGAVLEPIEGADNVLGQRTRRIHQTIPTKPHGWNGIWEIKPPEII